MSSRGRVPVERVTGEERRRLVKEQGKKEDEQEAGGV